MNIIERKKVEYGGFLPLELNLGVEYFAKYEHNLKRFNSVKASLDYLIRQLRINTVYIPYYYCPSTIEAIRKTGVEIQFYHLDERLQPIDLYDEKETMIIIVDYFGVKNTEVNKIATSLQNAEVVIDRAHAFFADPIVNTHVHNIYSAKKFFGVPDGAYLVSEVVDSGEEVFTSAHSYAGYLLTSYEEGTNVAYQEKKYTDELLALNYQCMSKLSMGLLKNVDYERVKTQRIANYKVFRDIFDDLNELFLPNDCVAYQFPLLIDKKGQAIKKKLVEERIYVSTLWSGKDLLKDGNEFELSMSDNCIFLPVDQRYDEEDMKYIAERIFNIWRGIV